jgi:hypothetical protein
VGCCLFLRGQGGGGESAGAWAVHPRFTYTHRGKGALSQQKKQAAAIKQRKAHTHQPPFKSSTLSPRRDSRRVQGLAAGASARICFARATPARARQSFVRTCGGAGAAVGKQPSTGISDRGAGTAAQKELGARARLRRPARACARPRLARLLGPAAPGRGGGPAFPRQVWRGAASFAAL